MDMVWHSANRQHFVMMVLHNASDVAFQFVFPATLD
jgi:hypothetical protein